MPKIKINTFGEGIEIRQLKLDPATYESWKATAAKRNCALHDLLLDPFFYHGLKHKKIKQLTDLDANLISGMLPSTKSHTEIWFKRHKVLKIHSHELFNEMVFFPLFNIIKNSSFIRDELENGIYILQKTIGLLKSEQLEIGSDQLNIEDFSFVIDKFENNEFLTEITYQNQKLDFIKSEAIITYQTAFEINNFEFLKL